MKRCFTCAELISDDDSYCNLCLEAMDFEHKQEININLSKKETISNLDPQDSVSFGIKELTEDFDD